MKSILLFLTLALVLFQVEGDHLVLGNVSNRVKLTNVNQTSVQYNAYPFMKRVKQYFYTQPQNKNIVGIQALDNLHSKASINITAGGVGYPFVNMRLKSERGTGLDYHIGIYIADEFYYQ